MDASDIAAVVSAGAAVVSLTVAIFQTAAAKDSAAAAADSASAAESQAVEAERSADAAETQVEEAKRAAEAAERQVDIMRAQLTQSEAEWTERRVETLRGVVGLLVAATEDWYAAATALVECILPSAEFVSDERDMPRLLEQYNIAVRSVTAAIASTLPYLGDLPFGHRLVSLSLQISRSPTITAMARRRIRHEHDDSELVASQFLREAMQEVNGLREQSARWLLEGTTSGQ